MPVCWHRPGRGGARKHLRSQQPPGQGRGRGARPPALDTDPAGLVAGQGSPAHRVGRVHFWVGLGEWRRLPTLAEARPRASFDDPSRPRGWPQLLSEDLAVLSHGTPTSPS